VYSTHRLTRIDTGDQREVDPSPRFSLGTSTDPEPGRNASLSPELGLTEEEFVAIDTAAAAIDRTTDQFTFRLVERNYLDLVSIHKFVTITVGLGRQFGSPDRLSYGEAVMAAAINWLGSVRLFLDHAETDLKRRFGNPSPQADRFKAAASTAFDTNAGYRFIAKFRNYVQHCGRPASRLSGHAVDGRSVVVIELDRDELLGSFDWGSYKAELAAMDESFDLMPLAAEAMEGLRAVHHELLLIALEDAAATSHLVVEAAARIEAAGMSGYPSLFVVTDQTANEVEVSFRRLNVEGAVQLQSVVDEGRLFEDLIAPRQPADPTLAPAKVAGQVHAETRGAQAMSAFYALADTDRAAFDRVLNELIEADGDVSPTITGLINLCAVLAAIAGLSLGRNPQGLIAALAEEYAQPDAASDDPQQIGEASS
jgi:hypothetical protein